MDIGVPVDTDEVEDEQDESRDEGEDKEDESNAGGGSESSLRSSYSPIHNSDDEVQQ